MEKNQKMVCVRVNLSTADYEALKRATLLNSVIQNTRLTEGDYLVSLFHADQAAKFKKAVK